MKIKGIDNILNVFKTQKVESKREIAGNSNIQTEKDAKVFLSKEAREANLKAKYEADMIKFRDMVKNSSELSAKEYKEIMTEVVRENSQIIRKDKVEEAKNKISTGAMNKNEVLEKLSEILGFEFIIEEKLDKISKKLG
jgi:hypothetical protein